LKFARLALVTILSLVLILGVCPLVQADDNKAEIELKVKIVAPPPPERKGAAAPKHYLWVDLYGEKSRIGITSAGEVKTDFKVVSTDEMVTLYISKGVFALTKDGQRLSEIKVWSMAEPPPLENGCIIIAYSFTPDGVTFSPPIELEIRYDPAQIPAGIDEKDLLIAYYDEETGEWIELDGVVDTASNTITAELGHFTAFAIVGYQVAPGPAAFTISSLAISPTEVDIGQNVTINAIVVNTGGETGSYRVILKINGVVEATEEVTVSAGASKKVTFTTAKDVAGSYSVDVNGLSDSFAVTTPVPTPTPTPPVPTPTPAPPVNWALVGGIIGGVALVGLGIFFWRRKRT